MLTVDGMYGVTANHSEVCSTLLPHDLLHKRDRVTINWLYYVLTIITSLLSIIGSLTIIIIYNKMAALQMASRKMLVYLSISDLIVATGNLIGAVW